MTTAFTERRRSLQRSMEKQGLSGLLITHPANWYYLTGFTGEAGAVLVSRESATLLTDGRFMTQARQETSGVRIVQQKGSLWTSTAQFLREHLKGRVGFNASQLTVGQLTTLRKESGRSLRFTAAPNLVESLRARKEPSEIRQMRKAALLAGTVMQSAMGLLRPGVREIEVAAEIDYEMKQRGASNAAFETIVAFGRRSALPHARPTSKRLKKNELVVLDLGAILGHYCSDITRTVFVGRAPMRVREWYAAVLQAQGAAIAAVKAGVSCEEVDAAARVVLAKHRLDHYFVHGTGHGLGLEVHEEPRMARGQKQTLFPGNVVTVEPGIYVPGVGGIRIEDDVAVRTDGAETLTRVPRDLIEL